MLPGDISDQTPAYQPSQDDMACMQSSPRLDDDHKGDEGDEGDEAQATRLRADMVERLKATGALSDPAVERALLAVPRHDFLPGHSLEEAYANVAVTTSWESGAPVSSVSQPEIVAVMLQQLRVQPGMRVLEVGAGSGYNAALLAELVGPLGSVISLEIDTALAAAAEERLLAAGYSPQRARIIGGDGWRGWPSGAPYDRVELTVGASDISRAWFEQLAEGGLLVAPLWLGATDASVALRKRAGALVSESWTLCGFVRLRGEGAETTSSVRLSNRLTLTGPNAQAVANQVDALLATRARRLWWGQPGPSFIHYLALTSGSMLSLWQTRFHRRPRARFLLYMDGADGPSMVIFPNRAPALLAFGGMAAERFTREQSEVYRQHGAPPIETWRLVARPQPISLPPPPLGVARLATPNWVYDISLINPGQS